MTKLENAVMANILNSQSRDYCKPGDDLPFEMEYVQCDLCGSQNHLEVYRRRDSLHKEYFFRVVECQNCGLGFVNPRPTLESLKFFYPRDFYKVMSDPSRNKDYMNRLKYLGKGSSNSLLDIGCGQGDFPLFLKKNGWSTVEGHEIFCDSLIKNINIHTMPLQDLANSGRKYDIICSWAVFEHLTQPSLYFAAVKKLLKPSGTFIFLVTNFCSPASRLFMQEDVPRHLHFFSEDTCKAYLAKFDLKFNRIYHRNDIFSLGFPFTIEWILSQINSTHYDDLLYDEYKKNRTIDSLTAMAGYFFHDVINGVANRSLKIFFKLLRRNGIIIISASN